GANLAGLAPPSHQQLRCAGRRLIIVRAYAPYISGRDRNTAQRTAVCSPVRLLDQMQVLFFAERCAQHAERQSSRRSEPSSEGLADEHSFGGAAIQCRK